MIYIHILTIKIKYYHYYSNSITTELNNSAVQCVCLLYQLYIYNTLKDFSENSQSHF